MASFTDEELARYLFGAVEPQQFDFAGFTELYKEDYGELPQDEMFLYCPKCFNIIPLQGALLRACREKAGVPPGKIVSWELGMYFRTEDCSDEQATITLVESVPA